ncbi:ExeM/NucH family extracellular endonuclease [Noviherbaspirillum malthae]|jgi:predicted extracellular nuclease|uniref:ExeM/NucH family extracellular endonuclease n=1 Tax=Noviherbaspirillum malthae TaxID=1260987 RepID=UPI00188F5A5C|nr:ExeM/NucH family extracellular endonuclease [Noviherbaspirillum malthae]
MASRVLNDEIRIAYKLGELKQLVRTLGGTAADPIKLADELISAGLFAAQTNDIKIKQLEQAVGTPALDLLLAAFANRAPTAADDRLSAVEDRAALFTATDLLGNDNDADGDTLAITAITSATGGTATLNADGSVSFTAAPDFNGEASFTYQVSDGGRLNGVSNTATVHVLVAAVNDAPVRTSGEVGPVTMEEDAVATPLNLGVVTYAAGGGADEAAQTLSVTVTGVPDATLGHVVLADGVTVVVAGQTYSIAELRGMAFAPAADAHGSASFRYEVRDSGGTANGGTDTLAQEIAIHVQAVNDAPDAVADTLRAGDQGITTFTATQLLANDRDVDGDALTITAVTAGKGGSVSLNADGTISFIPETGFTGSASFTYTVTDGAEQRTAAATVDVTTRISAIQGEGAASTRVGESVLVEARVTAWAPEMKMFWVQEETADQDGNVRTSEGVAVYYGNAVSPVSADSLGDIVRFSAKVTEFRASGQSAASGSLTELTGISGFTIVHDGTAADIEAAAQVTLPVATADTLEQYEGMLVEVTAASGGDLFVADTYTFGRFGEMTFYADDVPLQFTQQNLPDAAANAAYLDLLARSSIQLEDRSTAQNPSLDKLIAGSQIERNGVELSAENFVRAGDTANSLTGVLSFDRGIYELQPVQTVNLTGEARPVAPDEAAINANGTADIKVASFNVLNYFTSLSVANTTADNFATPYGNTHEPRGANTPEEFLRQQAKLVEAITGTGADVLGLMEMQNNGFGDGTSAIDSLVDALNAKAGTGAYAYVRGPYADGSGAEPTAGSDAIMVAIIYKTATVKPLGQAVTPDSAVYSAFAAANRPPIAQTFGYVGDESKQFTLVVNHFKSKGDGTEKYAGDADSGDGQGAFNATRLEAAVQLAQWLESNPTGATDGDYLMVGDLNSYAMEDPIRYLTGTQFDVNKNYGGYSLTDAGKALSGDYTLLGGTNEYSYVFDGLRGSLDHALASDDLAGEITGVTHWHINADEQIMLDYNTEFNATGLYRPDAYRSSDHDPVVVGLRLNSEEGSPSGTPPADTTAPALVGSSPVSGAAGIATNANIVFTFDETVQKGSGRIVLRSTDGASEVAIDISGDQVSVNGSTVTVNPAADLLPGKTYTVTVEQGAFEDASGNTFAGITNTELSFSTVVAAPVARVVISEIHYDNVGTDVGEAIAVSGTAGMSLDGWSLVLYNGANGATYNTRSLNGVVIDNEGGGYGEVVFNYPVDGIQNGSPDGIALIDNTGAVVQFLSYEGVMTAASGPAQGMISIDIGASQASAPVGQSLQLIGNAWQTAAQTMGALNAGFTPL